MCVYAARNCVFAYYTVFWIWNSDDVYISDNFVAPTNASIAKCICMQSLYCSIHQHVHTNLIRFAINSQSIDLNRGFHPSHIYIDIYKYIYIYIYIYTSTCKFSSFDKNIVLTNYCSLFLLTNCFLSVRIYIFYLPTNWNINIIRIVLQASYFFIIWENILHVVKIHLNK